MTYAAECLADSPDALWLCDDGTGDPTDSSGNGRDLTANTGTAAYYTDPTLGTVLDVSAGYWADVATLTLGSSAWTLTLCQRRSGFWMSRTSRLWSVPVVVVMANAPA